MNKIGKIVIVVALTAAVAGVIAVKQNKSGSQQSQIVSKGLPVLIDLGAGTCIPCKLMAPILQELKTSFADKLQVKFLDVHENPDLISKYSVRVIPTQIFYGPSGKELFRHEGFMSKEDILAKWKELGVELTKAK